jgi:hypothetical protein
MMAAIPPPRRERSWRSLPPPWSASLRAGMGLLLSVILGGVIWVVLWAIGFKSFDGWLIMIAIILLTAGGRLLAPFLPGGKRRPERSARLR